MVLSAIKNLSPKTLPAKNTAEKAKTDKKPESASQYRSVRNGFIFGAGAGLGDGLATVLSARYSIKKNLAEYSNYSFADKKNAVANLHAQGINVKTYKSELAKVYNKPLPKVMAKRALMYGAITAAVGLGIDLYKNHNKPKVENTQNK